MMNGVVLQEGIQPDAEAADLENRAFLANNNNLLESDVSPIRTRVSDTFEYVPMSVKSLQSISNNAERLRAISVGSCISHDSNNTAHMNSRKFSDTANGASSDQKNRHQRMVAVRYFLDRPGYGLHDSAVRLWFDPPALCTPVALRDFLEEQGIALTDLLTEVYLDKFQSFMLLEACEAAAIEWDLKDTTTQNPGTINIRLTDVSYARRLDDDMSKSISGPGSAPHAPQLQLQPQQQQQQQHANTTPISLFAFSMMVGLETANAMITLVPGSFNESFVLAWGPYMFFVGGMLQTTAGILQVFRNNIFGAVVFLVFGSFWLANGTKVILETYFAGTGTEAADLTEPDPWGSFIRASYVFAFAAAALKQTFVLNKLSTILVSLLCCKVFFQALAGWSDVFLWIQVVFGWTTSIFAYYLFVVEFTNQVYHREVFNTYKWSEKHSPEEVFGIEGKSQTLYSKAALLRQARFPNISGVRSAMAGKDTLGEKTE
jgi:succinate-acetate transporter protein